MVYYLAELPWAKLIIISGHLVLKYMTNLVSYLGSILIGRLTDSIQS